MLDYCTMRAQLRGTLSSRDKCDGMPRRGEPNAIDRTLHSRAQDNDPHADTARVSTRDQPAELATPGARILSPHRLLTCDEIEQLGGDLLLPCAGDIEPKYLNLQGHRPGRAVDPSAVVRAGMPSRMSLGSMRMRHRRCAGSAVSRQLPQLPILRHRCKS